MLTLVFLTFLQAPPGRVHQPGLVDPGLHGGRIYKPHPFLNPGDISSFDGPGDTTPDGRVYVCFREQQYEPGVYLWAVVAGAVDPARIQASTTGHLSAFYDPTDGTPGDNAFGEDFTFSAVSESKVLYWSPPFLGADTPYDKADDMCGIDPVLPLPNGGKSANVALAMRPDPSLPGGENPYPSDSLGNFEVGGNYRTYKIWMVTDHHNTEAQWTCNSPQNIVWIDPGAPAATHRLAALDIDVILDVSGATPTVASAKVLKPQSRNDIYLRVGSVNGILINGVEPSITADGTLIVYHGSGHHNVQTDQRTTYIWNPNGSQRSGWSAPLSVTMVPPPEYGAPLDGFARLYGFAKYPICEPDGTAYAPGDLIFGAYPWVSKDGSFFAAMHVRAIEDPGPRRCGMFVCGDITGGYIKHVDDTALNPTRLGGPMWFPQAPGNSFKLNQTGRTSVFTTGLKPGLWEPLLGEDVPVPTQSPSERIPVLPFFVHRTRQYGEVRFEEADKNYLLYLACNESFDRYGPAGVDCNLPQLGSQSSLCTNFVTSETPDTSGRSTRALCTLNSGAAFPRDMWTTSTSGVPVTGADIRLLVGAAIGAAGLPLHENLGYKGQAIVFSMEGHVKVDQTTWEPYNNKLTVQAFVKVLPGVGAGALVEDTNRFLLRRNADGSITARVKVKSVTYPVPVTQEFTSNPGVLVPPPTSTLGNPGLDWNHIVMTFDGAMGSKSRLELFVDGVSLESLEWNWTSKIASLPSATLYVGPGRGTPAAHIGTDNVVLAMDEVAISSVVRTIEEIRRDAYVAQDPSGFEPVPSTIPLPIGLERSESKWPVGLAYSAAKGSLGQSLFHSPLLSLNLDRSCSTCHKDDDFLADANTVATSEVGGLPLPFNVPTAYNMAFGTHKMFDGSAASVEAQVTRPITGSEMGPLSMATVIGRLKADGPLSDAFDAAYSPLPNDGHINEANFREALAMFVRTEFSASTAFDSDSELRKGNSGIPLGAAAHRGRSLFFGKARCFGCHRGTNLSDDDFHNIGTVPPSGITGRGGFTLRTSENGMLKTPTLRNVAQTGPWFHDGSKTSLTAVIDHYNSGFATAGGIGSIDRQLRPLNLSPGEKSDLEAFLNSLTGP